MSCYVQPCANPAAEFLARNRETIHRIVVECVEVSFALCNIDLNLFGVSKVFDVFNQLITTALVLETGYWPFYSTNRGQSLCVCGRYGIVCRHVKSNNHWIDMESVPTKDDNEYIFYPKQYGHISPMECNINMEPSENINGYNLSIHLCLEYKKLGRGRPRRYDKDRKDLPREKRNYTIRSRYALTSEFYPVSYGVMFQPSPFFHTYYGGYFKELLDKRGMSKVEDKYFMVSVISKSSLVLIDANLPLYNIPNQLYAVMPNNEDLKHKMNKQKKFREPMGPPPPYPIGCMSLASLPSTTRINESIWKYPEPSIGSIYYPQYSNMEATIKVENPDVYDYDLGAFGYNTYQPTHTYTDTDINPIFNSLNLQSCNISEALSQSIESKILPATLTAIEDIPNNMNDPILETNGTTSNTTIYPTFIEDVETTKSLMKPSEKTQRLINEFDTMFPTIKPRYFPKTRNEINEHLDIVNEYITEDLLSKERQPNYWSKKGKSK